MIYNSGVTSQREFEVPIMNTMLAHAAATPPEDSNTRLIPLTQGKFAIVDATDFEWLNQWKWCAIHDSKYDSWYAARRNPLINRQLLMHRVILDAPKGMHVDHQDGDGLRNTRKNIRLATMQQNHFNRGPQRNNTSGYKGVTWYKTRNKWVAQIQVNRKNFNLGYFDDPRKASEAYAEAARHFAGDFFRTERFARLEGC